MDTMSKIIIWQTIPPSAPNLFVPLRCTKRISAQVGLQILDKLKSQIKIKVHALFANF